MKATQEQIAQAEVLSARYRMPKRTVLAWQKAKGINGFTEWLDTYGPCAMPGLTNAQSHDRCLQDIFTWLFSQP